MILRIWKTQVVAERAREFEEFGRKYTTPHFQQYTGFLGVFYTRTGTSCATVSLWKDMKAVEKLATSQTYQDIIEKIQNAGFLKGEQFTEAYEVQGGSLQVGLINNLLEKM